MNESKKKLNPVFAIYSVGAVWAICGLILPLYSLFGIILTAIISAAAYLFVRNFLCEKVIETVVFEKTGISDADNMIKIGREFIKIIENQTEYINNEVLAKQGLRVKKSASEMFDYISKNPSSARQLNSFIEYYFPTVIKLLDTYIELQDKAVSEGSAAETLKKIDDIMESICTAFDKQLNMLYEHKNLDIKTDIDVLKSMLARENLA